MRRATPCRLEFGVVLLLAALTACSSEPDFDERYDAASAKITQTARDIDSRIAGTEAPASELPAE